MTDVAVFQDDAAKALLHGINPYSYNSSHKNIYGERAHLFYGPGILQEGHVHVGDPYPPLSLFWSVPGYLLGDVRYSFLAAIAIAAVLMFRLSPGPNGLVSVLLFLLLPLTSFVLEQAWTDPLMVVTLTAVVYTAAKKRKLLPIALGLFLASKQHSALVIPLAALLLRPFSWKAYLSLIGKAIAVTAAVDVPFFVLDARGFWWSLVGFQVAQPVRPDALSFSALLINNQLRPIPQTVVAFFVALAIWLALRKAPRTPFGFAMSVALVYLPFFALNKQAFANYYYFVFGTLCLALAAAPLDLKNEYAALNLNAIKPVV